MTTKVDRHELRHGGEWRLVHTDAGGAEYAFRGVFHGDPSPNGAVRTFEFEGAPGHVSLETVIFEERDGKTFFRAVSVYQSLEARDAQVAFGMEPGVIESMTRLDELLTRLT